VQTLVVITVEIAEQTDARHRSPLVEARLKAGQVSIGEA
jgi:hypothetical protein